ncbi:MAG: hypothetical protein LBK61_01465 [Spirochaetaceae bacterium]|jgi:hypothetical protein|nr:hypothetical protein [Spirochaetaceae bacterium]
MEKKFFTGMAVLLIASLFFLGCPTDNDDDTDDGTTPDATDNWYDGLGSSLSEAADGTVTLTATDTTLTTAVIVPKDKTVVVDSGKTLSIGSGGSLAGTVASGSTAAAAVVIKGTVTGGENFYAAGTALAANAIAAGVYAWDAAAGGGSTAGWKQTALALTGYSLKENGVVDAAVAASGVTLDSVLKDNATGVVTVKLGGKFKPEYLYYGDGKNATAAKAGTKWNTGAWGPAKPETSKPKAGQYGAVYIQGFGALSNVAIETINPGFVFYTGITPIPLSDAKLDAPKQNNTFPNIYLNGDNSQRWVIHASLAANKALGIMLFSGAATGNKKVTLDFDQYSGPETGATKVTTGADGGDILDVVIDYSDVDFTATGTETDVASSYSLRVSEAADAAEVGSDFGVNIASVKKNAATNTVTIKLGGTFGGKWIYDGKGTTVNATTEAGGKWNKTTWGPASDAENMQPLVGKYGAVYIKGFSSDALANVAIEGINPALVFYTGLTAIPLSDAKLGAPVTNNTFPNIYLDGDASQRWVLYDSLAVNKAFGIMLFSGATDKTVTLDIDQYTGSTTGATKVTTGADGGDILNVVIDYADVLFPAAVDLTP